MNINERNGVNTHRFRVTEHDGGAILNQEELKLQDLETIANLTEDKSISFITESTDGIDSYSYLITFSPFRIEQRVNGVLTSVVNKKDSLMFEDYQTFYNEKPTLRLEDGKWEVMTNLTSDAVTSDCLYPILERLNATFLERHYGPDFLGKKSWIGDFIRKLKSEMSGTYPRESYMMSFYMATEHLYGLPERSGRYYLNRTKGSQPYRLYSSDKFPHIEWES